MHDSTKKFLATLADSKKIHPTTIGTAHVPYMTVVREAHQEVAELRMRFAEIVAIEPDRRVASALEFIDQKLGAYEREVRKLADQTKLVHRIAREINAASDDLPDQIKALLDATAPKDVGATKREGNLTAGS